MGCIHVAGNIKKLQHDKMNFHLLPQKHLAKIHTRTTCNHPGKFQPHFVTDLLPKCQLLCHKVYSKYIIP